MKRFTFILAAVLITASLAFSQGVQVTLLHTSDSHSHLTESGVKNTSGYPTQGGISRFTGMVGYLKATEPNPLFFHCGDYSVGDFMFNSYFGVPELQILQGVGCDAMAVGNHEFDLGPDPLLEALSTAFPSGGFPLLSANCDMTAKPNLENFIKPRTMINIGGINVGVFGLTIPDPTINSAPVIITEDIMEKAYENVMILRSGGADVVVCLSHLGFNLDYLMASNIPGIDFILGGHDHGIQNTSVTNPGGTITRIYHSGEYYMKLGKISFTFSGGLISNVNYQLININNTLPSVPEIDATVEYLKAGIVNNYGDMYAPGPITVNHLEKNVNPESPYKDTPLGNLVTDSYRDVTGTEIGITVQGLMSEAIYQGGISGSDVFRSVGYGFDTDNGLGFRLVTFKLYGAELLGAMEFALASASQSADYYPQVSGMTFKFNSNRPDNKKIVRGSVRINGKLLKPAGSYTLTCNEGLYGILSSMGITGRDVVVTGTNEFTALYTKIATLGSVNYQPEGRIKDAKYLQENDSKSGENTNKIDYKLHENYPNPFNPVTNIKYTIAQNSLVNISIYDVTGRLVKNLVNEIKNAGTYTIQWNASGLSSGVYFCRMMSGNFNSVKRLILTK